MRPHASVSIAVTGILVVFSVTAPDCADAQTTTLRGRVVSLDGAAAADARLRMTGIGELALFQSGEFSTEIPADVELVELVALEPGTEVVYPPGGRLPVPMGGQSVTIVVGEPAIEAVRDALAERSRLLGQVLEENQEATGQLVNIDESLRAILERLDLREEDLRDEVERGNQRAAHFPRINEAVRSYILETRDLHDVLVYVGGTSESPAQLLETLKLALPPYNAAYERIKSNAAGFGELIERHWDGGARLSAEFMDFWEERIEELHRDAIEPMNSQLSVIQTRPGGREAREARETLVAEARILDRELDELEREAEALLATLAAP